MALAVASVSDQDEPLALNVALPKGAVTSQKLLARTSWSATVRETAAPTAVSVPLACPLDLVVTLSVCCAVTARSPVLNVRDPRMPLPSPSSAIVVAFEMLIATTAAIEVPPVLAPLAVVVSVSPPVALRVRLLAPVSDEPSWSPTTFVLSTMFKATEAPMPVLGPPAFRVRLWLVPLALVPSRLMILVGEPALESVWSESSLRVVEVRTTA